MKKSLIHTFALILSFAVMLVSAPSFAAEMKDYCVIPPYVQTNVDPNIMIIMDNSKAGGAPAYRSGPKDSAEIDTEVYYGDYTPDDGIVNETYPNAPGLFRQDVMYYYEGGVFNPTLPGEEDYPRADAVFEGNMLNWATTSMYDLIQFILVGGKSTSRQTNAHTLISDNAGDWPAKIYHYTGTNGNRYTCLLEVNVDGSGDLKISDNPYYKNLGQTCGLILTTPIGPNTASKWSVATAGPEDDDTSSYAKLSSSPAELLAAEIRSTMGAEQFREKLAGALASSATGSAVQRADNDSRSKKASLGILNTLMGLLATPAYAAKPLDIITPNVDGAILANGTMWQPYTPYAAFATGGDGIYKWSATGMPVGLTMTSDGMLSGIPGQVGTFLIVFTVTDADGAGTSVSRTASITIEDGPPLRIEAPLEGMPLRDGFRGETYNTMMVVTGCSPWPTFNNRNAGCIWTLTSGTLPENILLNGNAGILLTLPTIDPSTGKRYVIEGVTTTTTFPLVFQVKDRYTGETLTLNTSITIRQDELRILNDYIYENTNYKTPVLIKGKNYPEIITIPVSGGSGNNAWTLDSAPAGLVIDSNGTLSGTVADTVPVGMYSFKATVTDTVDNLSDSVVLAVEVVESGGLDVEIAWPNDQYYADSGYASLGSIKKAVDYPLAAGGFGRAMAIGNVASSYTWSVSSSLKDIGLDIDPATGVLFGRANPPTCPASASCDVFGVISVLAGSHTGTVNVHLTIDSESAITLLAMAYPSGTVTTPSAAPMGALGYAYDGFTVITTGGTGPVNCKISGDSIDQLPLGLALDEQTCAVTGRVSAAADLKLYTVTFDAWNVDDLLRLNVVSGTAVINLRESLDALAITNMWNGMYLEPAPQGLYYELRPRVVGGVPPYTWSTQVYRWRNAPASGTISDILHAETSLNGEKLGGMTTDASTGLISGIPMISGRIEFRIIVKDSTGATFVNPANGLPPAFGLNITQDALIDLVNVTDNMYLPTATVGVKYTNFNVIATGGISQGYTFYTTQPGSTASYWLPTEIPGMYISDGGTLASPAGPSVAGTYQFQLCARDLVYTRCKLVNLEVAEAGFELQTKAFNLKICASDDEGFSCNTPNVDLPADYSIKEGLLQSYWGQARFGLISFDKTTGDDGVDQCIPIPNVEANEENFYTAVENANPSIEITKLVSAEYDALTMFTPNFKDVETSCQDPFVPKATDDFKEPPCRRNFILMLTSGEGADNPPAIDNSVAAPMFSNIPSPCDTLVSNLAKDACYGYVTDMRPDRDGTQNVSTYIVNMLGSNEDILMEAANNSGGQYFKAENPAQVREQIESALADMIKKATSGTAASVLASGEGSGANIIQAIYYPRKRFRNSDTKGYDEISWIGKLSGFWYYADPYYSNSDIRAETQTSTPAELNLKEDYIIQSYYDPDTQTVLADRYQDVDGDGSIENDDGADGTQTDLVDTVLFDNINPLWEAGKLLWQRDLASRPRKILVNLDDSETLKEFNATLANTSTLLQNYMNLPGDALATEKVVLYMHGYDFFDTRPRLVKVDLDGDGETTSTGETEKRVWKLGDILNSSPTISTSLSMGNNYYRNYNDLTYKAYLSSDTYKKKGMVFAGGNDGMLHAFKLGYLQQIESSNIKAKMYNSVSIDANGTVSYAHSSIENAMGYEQWAFIPKNVLPYLKYVPQGDYCHIYMVDLTVTLVDASVCATGINIDGTGTPNTNSALACKSDPVNSRKGSDSWRSVLIGGMRYGGACKNPATGSCTVDTNGDGTVNADDCVFSPREDVGYSSYFALDITDELNPRLMWEFTHPDMGYSTARPNVFRISETVGDTTTTGKWFAVIGSGPTGPIDKNNKQFVGASDQPLKLFVLDLRDGELLATITPTNSSGGSINNAYALSMGKVSSDINTNYSDEVIYVGYSQKCTTNPLPNYGSSCPLGSWRDGGVVRVLTLEDVDPNNWVARTLIQGVGPVSAAATKMYDQGDIAYNQASKQWVFFATGRYLYERDEPFDKDASGNDIEGAVADDLAGIRHIFGVIDPCSVGFDRLQPFGDPTTAAACADEVAFTDLNDATLVADALTRSDTDKGWFIGLREPVIEYKADIDENVEYGAERVITDLTADPNVGLLYVTSFRPYAAECAIGGETYFWAIDALTGGSPDNEVMQGVAVMQVSTGNIKKIDLSKDFTESGGRRTEGEVGVASMDQSQINAPGESRNRLLHIIERY